MLRKIVQTSRRVCATTDSSSEELSGDESDSESGVLEPWIEWIRRATANARDQAKKYKVTDWIKEMMEPQVAACWIPCQANRSQMVHKAFEL